MAMKVLLYVLVVLFGSSSWLSTNSVWMELPLLTEILPEGWSLPSYLTVIVQLACIGPLLYGILKKCFHMTLPSAAIILSLLIFCCVCTALMAFFWSQTLIIFGQPRSVPLMIIIFGMALVNATSNVLFMPFMASYNPAYLTAYFVGMGVSALFPSVVSIIQGSGGKCTTQNATDHETVPRPNFGVTEYNLVMLAWLVVASFAFTMICRLSTRGKDHPSDEINIGENLPAVDEPNPLSVSESSGLLGHTVMNMSECEAKMKQFRFGFLLLFMGIVNAQMNGIIPSIQIFASLPYSQATYHLSLTLSNIVSPLVCFLPLVVSITNLCLLAFMTLISSSLTALIVAFAAMSPEPPMQDSIWGSISIVSISVLVSALHSFLRTVLATALGDDETRSESRLFWGGALIQVGSFFGSCVMFPLVNIFKLFVAAPSCPT